jgi:acyl-homoserine lactone acylase PvdQ
MSDHYKDMTEGWIKGNYAVVNTNGNVIRSGGMKKMVIKKRE